MIINNNNNNNNNNNLLIKSCSQYLKICLYLIRHYIIKVIQIFLNTVIILFFIDNNSNYLISLIILI